MKIASIESIPVAIPYRHDGGQTGFGGAVWKKLTYLLIRVQADDGLVGWGEAFGYNVIPATKKAMDELVRPLALGKDVSELAAMMGLLKKALHIYGRSGPVQYALSGLDIALWDLAGKRAGSSVADMLGGRMRAAVPAYKSFMRLLEPAVIARACARAVGQGYRSLKLHETTVEAVDAARREIGESVDLMLDVNCEWPAEEAVRMAGKLAPYRLKWLEEPIWPPEDTAGLARLRKQVDVPLALGENLANAVSFLPLLDAGVVDYFQPSVTKVGGISEVHEVALAADARGRLLAPHSPYFGPGLLATLQLAARHGVIGGIEVFGVDLEARLFGDIGLPGPDGAIPIPDGPGLGCDPDPDIVERYRLV
ncbi:mandelate racemase/muconate lactonizing enzyme family protein [Candidimonas humi]|uniref:Mandelate racemase/muconate lactonizing enzyme family protein n=1 Tax=Candidimonas humi TaxID=683355 RepID=A0ABV8NZA5_9BURK|nr:mandelate racemase/muconate lactonizing enzyme family protein [Candidimonas humi]